MSDIDSKACYDCRRGACMEHGVGVLTITRIPLDGPPTTTVHVGTQRACSRCGGLQNVVLLHHGWACDFCLGGDRMPDYEALGYPETGAATGDLDYAAYCVGFASRGIAASVIADELNAIQKDIPSSTDIVDSSSSDSYK